MKRHWERFAPYLFYGAILLIWEIVSRSGQVNRLILPAPSQILITTFWGFVSPEKIGFPILAHVGHTLLLLVVGFVLGAILGVVGGIVLGLSTTVHRMISPMLGFILPIPAIAWAPAVMIWVGYGTPTIICIVVFACFSEAIYNTAMGVRSIPKLYHWQIRSFGAGPVFSFFHVLLPAAFPSTLAGIRLGLAASWRSIIGAEMFAGVSWGLGFMLFDAEQFYATDVMFSSLIIVAAFGLFIEQGPLRLVDRFTIERWGMKRTVEA